MTTLEPKTAIVTCRGGRSVRVEYRPSFGADEFERDFPSITAAMDWCRVNNLQTKAA